MPRDGGRLRGTWLTRRRVVFPAFVGVVACALAVRFLMVWVEPHLPVHDLAWLPDYDVWAENAAGWDIGARLLWVIGDASEGPFFKSITASVVMIAFALFGRKLELSRASIAKTSVHTALAFPKMLAWSMFALFLAMLMYGWTLEGGWTPTFVVFLLTQILIGHFGIDDVRCATIAVLVALIPCPLSLLLLRQVTGPLGFPAFVACAFGMAISTIIICEVCRYLPWMEMNPLRLPQQTTPAWQPLRTIREVRMSFISRVLSDIADMPAVGGAWAGSGLVAGLVLGWELNPNHGVYGTHVTADLICALVVTAAMSVFIHYDLIRSDGFAFTFPSLLSTGAIAVTFVGHPLILAIASVVSAVVSPAIVRIAILTTPVSGRWPNSVYAQLVAGVITIALTLVANVILVILS